MSRAYIVDRVLHWLSALLIFFMLLNMRAQIHIVDYQVKGQVEHRQDAIQTHASVGILLLLVLLVRLVWVGMFKQDIPRHEIAKKSHQAFISLVQFLLYVTVCALAVTGFLMTKNADIPLTVYGFQISDVMESHNQFYGSVHDIHLNLISLFWSLIGIHFVGAIYARR